MILIAQLSPLGTIGLSLFVGFLSLGMIASGQASITTKTAKARKLEKLMANDNGQLAGGGAVLKGYILLVGGLGLCILSVLAFTVGVYRMFFA
ncbi:hypothetical protein [Novipirellula sp.]|uniref:hypothetical protein n=1 Tax=Novipirellula sp. TaxID=2795430 RepID=UPI003569A88A